MIAMRLFKSIALCFAFLACAVAVQAQGANHYITFDDLVHDFGTFPEEQGNATHTFTFTNKAEKPVQLVLVKASCGCTTPTWTQEPVAPGETGIIQATYNAAHRPGPFEKFITVRVQESDPAKAQTVILTIRGNVTPRVKTMADYYPFQAGMLRFGTNHLTFGRVYSDATAQGTFKIFNPSDKPVSINSIATPPHVALGIQQAVIQPNDSLLIPVTYDASKLDAWDFVHHSVYISTDDPTQAQKSFYVSAIIQENFGEMTEEDFAKAPAVAFDTQQHNFGTIQQGDVVTHEFKFRNEGQEELVVRMVKASCGCTAGEPTKEVLAPGEEASIKVTFNSTGKRGPQNLTVTMVVNDPHPGRNVIRFNLTGTVATEAGR